MVRTYIKKSNRQAWSEENMNKALELVKKEGNIYRASVLYKIPRETLRRKFNLYKNQKASNFEVKPSMGFKTIFTIEEENELVNLILEYESQMCGFTSTEVRALAYDLAVRLKKQHNFDNETKLAGVEWFRGFLKRYPSLSLRKPEPTSSARALGFNKKAVNEFFDNLENLCKRYNFAKEKIWNMDESGFSSCPKSCLRVVSMKGKRQVGTRTSAERGENVTAVLCMSARGDYMPPLLIFPRVKENKDYLDGAPAGGWAEFNRSGWMEDKVFTKWLKKFIDFTKASKDDPVLLLVDGHATHVKNQEAIELARENGVHMLCFPPHCTHKMQPLDVGYMKPLSNYYTSELNKWIREKNIKKLENEEKCNEKDENSVEEKKKTVVVKLKNIFSIFGEAYVKASTMSTAVNAFKKTGIVPFNREVFNDEDFVNSSEPSGTDLRETVPTNTIAAVLLGAELKNDAICEIEHVEKVSENLTVLSNGKDEVLRDPLDLNFKNEQSSGDLSIKKNNYSLDNSESIFEESKEMSIQEIAKKIKQEHCFESKAQNNQSPLTADIIIDLVTKSVNEVLENKFRPGVKTAVPPVDQKIPKKRPRQLGRSVEVTSDSYRDELIASKAAAKKPKKNVGAKRKALSDKTNVPAPSSADHTSNQQEMFVTLVNETGQKVLVPVVQSNIQYNQPLESDLVQYVYVQ